MEKNITPERKIRLIISIFFLSVSAVLWVFLFFSFFFQPEALSAATIVPPWMLAVMGLFLTLLGYSKRVRKPMVAMIGLWLVFLLVFAEEPWSLIRFRSESAVAAWESDRRQGKAIRVVSLNCAGSEDAALEAFLQDPDIVLLQESPGRKKVEELARRFFKGESFSLWHFDTSLVTRGTLLSDPAQPLPFCTFARKTRRSDHRMVVCDLNFSF